MPMAFTSEKRNWKCEPKAEAFGRFGQSQEKIPEFICFIKLNSVPAGFSRQQVFKNITKILSLCSENDMER
jgi:hypothetical protein